MDRSGLSIFDGPRLRGDRPAMFWETQGPFIQEATLDQRVILRGSARHLPPDPRTRPVRG